jgi:dipeptidyl aminopeptidase/acylaminoacyl peptidase
MQNRRRLLVALLLLTNSLLGQGTAADYLRARQVGALAGKVVAFRPSMRWLPAGAGGIFERKLPAGGSEFVLVSAVDGKLRTAATAAELGVDVGELPRLAPQPQGGASARRTEPVSITLRNDFDRKLQLFWIDGRRARMAFGELAPGKARVQPTSVGHVWLAEFSANEVAGVFAAIDGGGLAVFDLKSQVAANAPGELRPESKLARQPAIARVFVRDHDVYGADASGEFRLSSNGSSDDPYEEPQHWSPDGTKVFGFQTRKAMPHEVLMVDSSPKDQVQPKVQRHDYSKPGDQIAQPKPRLFDVAGKRSIAIDDAVFAEPWSIDNVRFSEDSSEVFCLYNRRGHQLLRLCAIHTTTGALRTIVEETTSTFVDYSQKTFLHWHTGGQSLLWASERDGNNHLYEVAVASGQVRQITRGDWLVRKVERVDEVKRQIWFTAYGIRPLQDPYFAHLARIDFDGNNLTVLTEANGTHEWTFSPDQSLLIDRWSRVDQPPVTELRRALDGSLVAELGRDDASELLATGYRPPESFVAKGRDGVTDIYGVIIRPSNFDPTRHYPVIEDIYAGPHDHFVPKRWGIGQRARTLGELGFVIVQIDGMGTNWRSKAFHDVCWQNLADSGFPDRIAWLRAAALLHQELDLARVGIFGGSAGGQSALAALLHHGEFYRAAAADCGCHDNRMDKIWWNEAFMGWPVGPAYAANSNVTHASKLTGKLLLTVGELDHNVDPASTMQVVHALIVADKDFEFVIVPGAGHGIGEGAYLVRRRQDFFVRTLLAVEPRR